MSDAAYNAVWFACWPLYRLTARPTILHADRARRAGGYILAANHHSPYDAAAVIAVAPRPVDFVSIVEFERKPIVGRFFRALNCVFVDRRGHSPAAVRAAADKLRRGRVVAMFPEASCRRPEASVTHGGPFYPGVLKLAAMTGCPIVPLVVRNAAVYARFTTYLPGRRRPVGACFGDPITITDPTADGPRLAAAFVALNRELERAMHDLLGGVTGTS